MTNVTSDPMVADIRRRVFIGRLRRLAGDKGIILSDVEWIFISRITAEDGEMHSGDRNICDSLRRRYEWRLS
jgi:hypothetical protein